MTEPGPSRFVPAFWREFASPETPHQRKHPLTMSRQALIQNGRGPALLRALVYGAVGLAASAVLVKALSLSAEAKHRPMGKFVAVGGAKIHYIDRGTGQPVICLHGNGGTLEDLASSGLIDTLAREYRVIALDRPGFGHSERPQRTWSPEEEAKLLKAFMRQLGIERPIIVAHSWGTLVALSAALEAQEDVSGLVLVCGYYYPTVRFDVAFQALISSPLVGDVVRHTVWPLIARLAAPAAIRRIFSPQAPSDAFLKTYPVGLAARPVQLRVLADDTVAMPAAAARLCKRYAELHLPIDILSGSDDRMVTTARHSRRLHEDLTDSYYDEIPGVGHMVHHFHPALISRRVAHVLQRAAVVQHAETGAK